MIVSHQWLTQFVPQAPNADTVGEKLSRHCVTLDGMERQGGDLSTFVVAQVVEASRHPNSDHLWVTKVDDGSGVLLDVVCGAPNVVAGHKYPFARTGTVMPGGLRIEKRKIRGETSNGMLCSARELRLGQEHDGILTLETDAVPGTPLPDVLPPGDVRLDLDVLPNRPDLLSHRGVAREVAAICGVPVSAWPQTDAPATLPEVSVTHGASQATMDGITVRVEDPASCPQYVAIVVRGVRVGASPSWLMQRLDGIGQRSISNIVDATNYILHGLGQPVHAFDLNTLADRTIVVRAVQPGETIVTLDGVTRAVPAGDAAICDASQPVAIAGVMGGQATEVTDATTDILLEVAQFDPRCVRRVRKHVGLSTDASYRFERGVDAAALQDIARWGAQLITQVAGGTIGPMLVVGATVRSAAPITLRPSRVARVLGTVVSDDEIVARLESLGCVVSLAGDVLSVIAPSWRHDLLQEIDLIEEVARLVGFDALPDELRPFRPGTAPDHPVHLASRRVRETLVGLGLAEARPMPFTATGGDATPRVRNPLAEDEPFLRASLLDTLARRAEFNLARMQGNVRLFEIGNAFVPSHQRLPREEVRVGVLVMGARRPVHFTEPQPPAYDIWDARSIAERVAGAAFPGEAIRLNPGDGAVVWTVQVGTRGVIGQVERLTLDRPVWASDAFGLEITLGHLASDDVAPPRQHAHLQTILRAPAPTAGIRVRPLPVTPAAEFDLALVVPDGVTAGAVEAVLREAGGDLLESCVLFDEFRGAGVPAHARSLAWRLTFRHPERTLREKEIEGRRARLLETVSSQLGVVPRAT